MAKQKKDPSEKLGLGNLLVWNSRQISTSVYVLMAGFLMAYCTDTLGINPALISIIMVASKLLDGVTDAFAGFIVDRSTSIRTVHLSDVDLYLADVLLPDRAERSPEVCVDLYHVFPCQRSGIYIPQREPECISCTCF